MGLTTDQKGQEPVTILSTSDPIVLNKQEVTITPVEQSAIAPVTKKTHLRIFIDFIKWLIGK